jgi:hypothetical protein
MYCPVVLTRFAAFRSALYARMEEISFRTALAVLTGVVAVAAVIAGVGLVMTQSPAPARPTALGPAPAAHVSTPASAPPSSSAPTPNSPSPSRPAPTSSAPARTPAPVKTSPAREATYPATAEDARPVAAAPHQVAPVRRPVSSAVAAWLAWWRGVLTGHRGISVGIGHGGLHGLGRR